MINSPSVPDDASSEQGIPLLTVGAILRLKADYEADLKLLEELPSRIKAKKRKYEASLFFAPPGFDPDAPAGNVPAARIPEKAADTTFQLFAVQSQDEVEEEEGKSRITWAKELKRLLSSASVGMSHQAALEKLKETSLGQRVSKGEKGFYNAVAYLEKRGELIKSGGLLYSAKLVEEMKARGELLPDVSMETRRRAGGSAAVVLELLREHPDGMDANKLREEVVKKPGMPASIAKHGHYIYNILAPLVGQSVVTKDANGIYRAVKEIA